VGHRHFAAWRLKSAPANVQRPCSQVRGSDRFFVLIERMGARRELQEAERELARRVALALELPEDYFLEFREAFLIERIKGDAALREQLYKRLRK
jgi:hypothetical protein